ncbi:MAG TPA: GAF domain-containing sensor histidine kinase, partial [Myxococcota bacterium]|nr:GAF domain-containing sensor histidine kinase [Myxococcota bacterium]
GAFERLEAASMLQGDIVREVRDFVPDYAQSGSLQSRALMEGRPLFLPEVDHASLLELTHGPAHVSLFERSDVRSLVSVPLRARGRTMGVLTLARGMGRRRFDATELGLAEELAARAALAADNARLYREAQDAVRVRDDFMAIASHELLTPLTSLSLQTDGAVRLVRSGDGAVLPRVATRVDAIRAQVTRLSQLVHELLDVSRIASGRMPVQPEWIDLAALVRDVVERCREEAERAGCALTLQAPAPVFGMWDKLRLDQVVTNLVMNAIKYGRTRPVGVAVELHRGRARLVVRDQGIGIDKAHHVRIFERFERAVSQRNYGGLGLGLWIARQIVEACGGRIRVISEVGQGATFTVDLPCGLPAEAGADVNVG